MNYKFKNSAAGPELILTPSDGHEITLLTEMLFDQRRGKVKSGNIEIVTLMDGNNVTSLSIREKAYVTIEVIRNLFQSVKVYPWGILGFLPGQKTLILLGNGTFKGFVVNDNIAFPDLDNTEMFFDKNSGILSSKSLSDPFSIQITEPTYINTIDELNKFITDNK